MINYILYDNQGTIQQQGSAPDRNLRVMRAALTDLKMLEIPLRLSDIDQYQVIDNQVVLRTQSAVQDFDYRFVRSQEYYTVGQQLDLLYKDIQAGHFGEAAKTGQFAQAILAVKQQYPKP